MINLKLIKSSGMTGIDLISQTTASFSREEIMDEINKANSEYTRCDERNEYHYELILDDYVIHINPEKIHGRLKLLFQLLESNLYPEKQHNAK
jgi:translation initiation factor 2 beta subunit (eIF-2beta)/eIF-5